VEPEQLLPPDHISAALSMLKFGDLDVLVALVIFVGKRDPVVVPDLLGDSLDARCRASDAAERVTAT
jgi:hypothetical protein